MSELRNIHGAWSVRVGERVVLPRRGLGEVIWSGLSDAWIDNGSVGVWLDCGRVVRVHFPSHRPSSEPIYAFAATNQEPSPSE